MQCNKPCRNISIGRRWLLEQVSPGRMADKTMIYGELFVEMPYAAALETEFLSSRCSTCFADGATMECSADGCGFVFYCSSDCRQVDQWNHKYECAAFKKTTGSIDAVVRLLARLLTRQLLDDGVAHLSEKFPQNIQDRPLGDLISHQRDIEKCPYRSVKMATVLKEFGTSFSDTPLVDDWRLVKRMYCVLLANCYSIQGQLDMNTGSGPPLGRGLYLNISRFDHSCRPDLYFLFHGSRMVILFPSTATNETAVTKERLALTRSAKKFHRLTVCYGYSKYYIDSMCPLRTQRRQSLQFGYYFRCRCVLCSDDRQAILEENAAFIECETCGQPYVWKEITHRSVLTCWLLTKKATRKCQKACSCGSNGTQANSVGNSDEHLKNLDLEFTHAMSFRMEDQNAEEIIERCEPVWQRARSYWHPKANLRMCQLHERLFISYYELAMRDRKPDIHAVEMALVTGEDLMAFLKIKNNKSMEAAMAACAYMLAEIYEISTAVQGTTDQIVDNFKRASHWYKFAASIWRAFGGPYSVYAQELDKKANMADQSAEAITQKIGMN